MMNTNRILDIVCPSDTCSKLINENQIIYNLEEEDDENTNKKKKKNK